MDDDEPNYDDLINDYYNEEENFAPAQGEYDDDMLEEQMAEQPKTTDAAKSPVVPSQPRNPNEDTSSEPIQQQQQHANQNTNAQDDMSVDPTNEEENPLARVLEYGAQQSSPQRDLYKFERYVNDIIK
jgi:hypothetical protein